MDNTLLNVVFEVPEWVKQGVDAGELRIYGGVARDKMGQIVYHLKNATTQSAKNVNSKTLPIIVAAGVLLAVAGGVYYLYRKTKAKDNNNLYPQLHNIEKDMYNYYAKNNFATITKEDIENLISSLSKLVNDPTFDHISMDQALYDPILEFARCINQSTQNLALNKNAKIEIPNLNNRDLQDIIDISISSLMKQKQLLFVRQ